MCVNPRTTRSCIIEKPGAAVRMRERLVALGWSETEIEIIIIAAPVGFVKPDLDPVVRRIRKVNRLRDGAALLAPRAAFGWGGVRRPVAGSGAGVPRRWAAGRRRPPETACRRHRWSGCAAGALAILLEGDFLQPVEIAQDVAPFGGNRVPAEPIFEFLGEQ